ncbi:hypothetical protein I4U23_018443 [Adineta vaga]|nr:hypothetical protein I4U23_018443 [Adineta vaga]
MSFSSSAKPYTDDSYRQFQKRTYEQHPKIDLGDVKETAKRICQKVTKKAGGYSSFEVIGAGFQFGVYENITFCSTCGLTVVDWPSDMKPFAIHSKRSPTCPFVLSMLPTPIDIKDDVTHLLRMTSLTSPCTDITSFVETDIVKQVRKRTFCHWPHSSPSSPSFSQMIQAGFFSCNVKDRVICIYCNIICQEWSLFTDDPFQLHKMLSPNCPYVRAMLNSSSTSSLLILNNHSTASQSLQMKAGKDHESSSTWSDESKLLEDVTARFDLPISRSLIKQGLNPSIIKRCWQDQLRLKHEDFTDGCDLFVACMILEMQIKFIDGKKENIIIPTREMRKRRNKEIDMCSEEQVMVGAFPKDLSDDGNGDSVEMIISSPSSSSRAWISKTTCERFNNLKTSAYEDDRHHQASQHSYQFVA